MKFFIFSSCSTAKPAGFSSYCCACVYHECCHRTYRLPHSSFVLPLPSSPSILILHPPLTVFRFTWTPLPVRLRLFCLPSTEFNNFYDSFRRALLNKFRIFRLLQIFFFSCLIISRFNEVFNGIVRIANTGVSELVENFQIFA